MEGAIQKVLDIFETDDGRTFKEKKKAAINDETGKHVKEIFWSVGNISKSDEHVLE